MADAPRVYDPTERRLRRLREQGRGPHISAARGAAVLVVTVTAAALVLRWAVGGPAQAWAGNLGQTSAAGLTATLSAARSIGLWAGMALGCVSLGAVVAAWATDAVWAGVSVHRRPLVSRVLWRPAACRPWLVGLGLEICALAIAAAVAWPLATASADEQALAPARLAPLGAIAFAIVVVVVAADLATSYLFFLSDARMSRADLVEERRETQPPPQVLRRRSRRFSRRRS